VEVVGDPEAKYRWEEVDRSGTTLVEWGGRHHRNSLTWKVWKKTAGVVVPARDHDHAGRRKNQVRGEEFPDAVYHCWRDGNRD
jgi:hypothetical protein